MIYILFAYALVSLVTFVIYGLDKRAAIHGKSRVPEARLHLLELFGGWPGALVAQQVFKHKRRKLHFLIVTWAIVLLHLVLWGLWLFGREGWLE